MTKKEFYHKIRLEAASIPMLTNRGMNYSANLQKPFEFRPTSFTSAVPGLKPKPITQAKQVDMFEAFLEDPFDPITYCVVSAPNDGMAKLLAAFMMQHAIKSIRSDQARTSGRKVNYLPVWHDLDQSFANPLLEDKVHASLLVMNNVGANSTPVKREKLRDILTHYADIPKIVVATGCDPFAFFTQYLYMTMNACAYMTTSIVQKDYEV